MAGGCDGKEICHCCSFMPFKFCFVYLNCSFYNPLACVEEAGSSDREYTDRKGTVQLSPGVSDNLGMHEGRDQSPLCPDPDGTCWGPFLSVGKSQVSGVPLG